MITLGGAEIADWMVDTFIYTSLLIALVLLIRKRVAEYFGPQIAYALWALPLLRFIMPPIVLPAWMQPGEPVTEAAPVAATESGEPIMVFITEGVPSAPEASAVTASPWFEFNVTDILLPLWLGGAAVFLFWRARDYLRMRRSLLEPARPVGEAGDVRLVETPAVSAPVAFGVRDKVVALPPEFMDRIDVTARDMAIAHELEHHRGRDLLANIAAQPLLALHWFNPLAWWGWRAMRRDQEAACDARVVAGRARSERAQYAEVIAGFAAGEHLALAAPMACPVLGEKSIIHRLRSLTMTDISNRRRKIGIAAITTTAMALPLTASISYAQAEPLDPPAAPAAPRAPVAPGAPVAPQPLEPPFAPDPDTDPEVEVIEVEGGQQIIISTVSDENGEPRVTRRVITRTGDPETAAISEAELAEILEQVEVELEGIDEEIERSVEIALLEAREGQRAGNRLLVLEQGDAGVRHLNVDCRGGETVARQELDDGRRAIVLCSANIEARAHAQAIPSLRAAMEEIERYQQLSEETRREILEELEDAVEEMEEARAELGRVSYRMVQEPSDKVPSIARVPAPRVTFGFTASPRPSPASAVRIVPMVHPLTGRSAQPSSQLSECEEEENTETRFRVQVTA